MSFQLFLLVLSINSWFFEKSTQSLVISSKVLHTASQLSPIKNTASQLSSIDYQNLIMNTSIY